MFYLLGLLVVLPWVAVCERDCSTKELNAADIVEMILPISMHDIAQLEAINKLYSGSGRLDKSRRDKALKKVFPKLQKKKKQYHSILEDLQSKDKAAADFIKQLVIDAARLLHDKDVENPPQSKTVLAHFNGLHKKTRDILLKKFPPLKSVFDQSEASSTSEESSYQPVLD